MEFGAINNMTGTSLPVKPIAHSLGLDKVELVDGSSTSTEGKKKLTLICIV